MNNVLSNLGVTTGDVILEFSYLLAAIFFVIGLKLLSHPNTARNGNLWAAGGMLLAIITTLIFHEDGSGQGIQPLNIVIILVVIAIGSVLGALVADPRLDSIRHDRPGAPVACEHERDVGTLAPVDLRRDLPDRHHRGVAGIN